MKKICCLVLACTMFLLSSCSLATFFNKSEAVNKNIDEDSGVINPVSSPAFAELSQFSDTIISDESKDIIASDDTSQKSDFINDELVPAAVIGGIPDDTWKEDGYIPVILYLRDSGGFVIPVTKKAVSQPAIARLTLSELIDNSVNRENLAQYGLYPTIPNETEILGLSISNGIATIDFSSNFLNYKTELDERNMISSIVYTMTQFANVTGVKFLCSGKRLAFMRFGSDATSVLYRANTLINNNKINVTAGMSKQDIYVFRNSDESIAYSLPLSLEYEGNAGGADFVKTVDLMSQVDRSGLSSLVPYGTKLIGSNLVKNTITLNFSNDIMRYAGNMREEAVLRQLLYTFGQFKGIENMKISIEGNQKSILPEGTDLSDTFKISKAVNLVID